MEMSLVADDLEAVLDVAERMQDSRVELDQEGLLMILAVYHQEEVLHALKVEEVLQVLQEVVFSFVDAFLLQVEAHHVLGAGRQVAYQEA